MSILYEQLRKLSTFIILLFFLFLVNVLFNINYKWEGVSVIVRVYLTVFSFYVIYSFFSIPVETVRDRYIEKYGNRGELYLFLSVRVFPLLMIYLSTVVFTLIDFMGTPDWPWNPFLEILNGKNSNILMYSVVLMIVLKIKKDPRISVPVFLGCSALYFMIYKVVYHSSPSGTAVSLTKLFYLIIVVFVLTIEYYYNRKNILRLTFISLFAGCIFYVSAIGIYYGLFNCSKYGTYRHYQSGLILLRMGYEFPLTELKQVVLDKPAQRLVHGYIVYSRGFNRKIDFNRDEWEYLFKKCPLAEASFIMEYIVEKNIKLEYLWLKDFIRKDLYASGNKLLHSASFIAYMSQYYRENKKDFLEGLGNEDLEFRLWKIDLIGASGDFGSVPDLTDMLTDMDAGVSARAYSSLKKITGIDPSENSKRMINSPVVIQKFKEFYQNYNRGS